MQSITIVLGIIAALLHGAAYLLYAIQTKVGRSSPKSASWGLWEFLVVINWLTFGVAFGNWIIALQFLSGSVACTIVFFYMLAIKKFDWPTKKHWSLIGLGLIAILVWWMFRNAAWANVIIFVALTISFIPMYESLYDDPTQERPLPWVIWTLAFLTTTVNVIVNWKHQPLGLVMPIGGAILHGAVAYLSCQRWRNQYQARLIAANIPEHL